MAASQIRGVPSANVSRPDFHVLNYAHVVVKSLNIVKYFSSLKVTNSVLKNCIN